MLLDLEMCPDFQYLLPFAVADRSGISEVMSESCENVCCHFKGFNLAFILPLCVCQTHIRKTFTCMPKNIDGSVILFLILFFHRFRSFSEEVAMFFQSVEHM